MGVDLLKSSSEVYREFVTNEAVPATVFVELFIAVVVLVCFLKLTCDG